MYILNLFNIDAWLYEICVSIYSFAADVYSLILDVASVKIMENDSVSTYASNISVLVGIFMLFRIAIALLSYLVDPDAVDDKKTGSSSLITGVAVSMLLLITYPIAFKALRTVQDAILNPKDRNNVLVQLFSGTKNNNSDEEVVNGLTCYYRNRSGSTNYDIVISLQNNAVNGSKIFKSYGLVNYVYYPGVYWDRKASSIQIYNEYRDVNNKKVLSKENVTTVFLDGDSLGDDYYEVTADSKNRIKKCPRYAKKEQTLLSKSDELGAQFRWNYYKVTLSNNTLDTELYKTEAKAYKNDAGRIMAGALLFSFFNCDSAKDEKACAGLDMSINRNDIEGAYDYILDSDKINDAVSFQGFLALGFGIVLILFLVVTTADVAVRAVKLIVLEVFAPFPIISYCDPKTRNVFESWLKTVGIVYADIFIRIIIIAICNFLVSQIRFSDTTGFVTIVLILGVLLFLKEAPQFICNMFGIKAQGLGNFTLNPIDKLKQVPVIGSAVSAVGSAATAGIAAAASGENFAKTLAASREGFGQGWRKNGGMMATGKETAPGFVGRTTQAVKQSRKAAVEKNFQQSRDDALYKITDQVRGTSHTVGKNGLDKGVVHYTASTGPTLRSDVQGINSSTSRIDNTTSNIYSTTQNIYNTTQNLNTTAQNINTTAQNIATTTQNIDATTTNINRSTRDISNTVHNIDYTTQDINATTQNIDFTTQDISDSTRSIDSKMSGPQNPGRVWSNGDDVGE